MFLEPRDKHMLLAVLPPAKTSPLGLVSFWKENTATPEDLNDSMSIMTPRLNLGGKNQGHYLHKEPKEMEPIVDLPRATHDHLTVLAHGWSLLLFPGSSHRVTGVGFLYFLEPSFLPALDKISHT